MQAIPRHGCRPTIGLLLTRIIEQYQAALWPAVAEAAAEQDANLIIFCGGGIRSPYRYDAQRNVVYDLIGPERLDGLILTTGSLGNFVTIDEMKAFVER